MNNVDLPSKQRKLRILLVRLSSGEFTDTEFRLSEAGHLITAIVDGQEAARELRKRPVNLVLVEGRSAANVMDVVAGLRGDNGRLSARYTPIFVLSPSTWTTLPPNIDGVLTPPLNCDALVALYLEFLSSSLSGLKRDGGNVAVCEIDAAIDRLGGDVELYKDLVARFLDDTAGTRSQLDTARQRRDATLLHRAAHSLKGLAASVGAVSVAGVLGELEALGREATLDQLSPVWERFLSETEKAAQELAPYHRSDHYSSAALQ